MCEGVGACCGETYISLDSAHFRNGHIVTLIDDSGRLFLLQSAVSFVGERSPGTARNSPKRLRVGSVMYPFTPYFPFCPLRR